MHYATIKKHDVANGTGVRVSLFVSGCTHHCKNCFNEEAWDFSYGKEYTEAVTEEILTALSPDYIQGLSLLGGEPFDPHNQEEVLRLLRRFKARYPEKDVWCYTGYDLEKELLSGKLEQPERIREMLSMIDILVDGRFVDELKNPKLRFKGSSNQRIIRAKDSLKAGKLIRWEDDLHNPPQG